MPGASRERTSALLLLVAASLLFAAMATVAKRTAARLSGAEVAFVRFVVGLASVAVVGVTVVRLRPVGWGVLAVRGLAGGLAVLFYFLGIAHLPVGTAVLLNYTAPVYTAIFAALFLRERVPRVTAWALALTLVGVALVVEGGGHGHTGAFGRWELCGLASAVLSGLAVTAVRAARTTDGPWEIFGAFCVGGTLVTAPQALAGWVAPTAAEWGLLIVVGLLSVAAQVLYTIGLREVEAALSGVISQLTPLGALALGAAFFHDRFSTLAVLGSLLTIGSVATAAWVARASTELPRT